MIRTVEQVLRSAPGARVAARGWLRGTSGHVALVDATGDIPVTISPQQEFVDCFVRVEGTLGDDGILTVESIAARVPSRRTRQPWAGLGDPSSLALFRAAHRAAAAARSVLDARGFIEVSTPLLWNAVGEYASGEFRVGVGEGGATFALPQSPMPAQLLAAVAGFDRTYQLGKCFRYEHDADEDARAHSAEFTQLNITLAGATMVEGQSIVEAAISAAANALGRELEPFGHLEYEEAVLGFGCDNPDWRYRSLMAEPAPGGRIVELGTALPAAALGLLTRRAATFGARVETTGGSRLLVTGEEPAIRSALRVMQTALGPLVVSDAPPVAACFVEGFPFLWEFGSASGGHNSRSLFGQRRDTATVDQFDVVMNGVEVASGGLKEVDAERFVQNLAEAGATPSQRQALRYWIEALENGPDSLFNCGIGWERLLATLTGTGSVYDFMLFPKSPRAEGSIFPAPH